VLKNLIFRAILAATVFEMKELRDGEARPIGTDKFQRDQELQHLVSTSLPSPPYGSLSLINSSHLTVLDPIYSAHLLAIAASNSGARFQIPLPIQMSVPTNASRIYTHGLPVNGLPATTIPNAQLEILSSLFEQSANNNNTINNKDEQKKVTSTMGKVKTAATKNNLQTSNNNNKKRTNHSAATKDMANNKKNRKPVVGRMASSENPMGTSTPVKKHPQSKDTDDKEMKSSIIPTDKTPPSIKVEEQAKSENGDSNKRSLAQQSNQSRDKIFSCPICNRCFGYKHVLQNHERTHTGEKPYFCTICDKRFTRDHHLKTHMRLHTGEKPYNCTHCDRQFVQVANLRRHLRVHTGERPYSCDFCPSRFSDSNQLKAHMMIHKGQKPYFCEECCGRFRRRHHLTHHKCTKDNKQPFSPPDLSPPSSIKRERKSRETRRIIRVAGLPVATVTSGLDPFIPVVPEQTHPEDLSLGSGPGLRSRNFSGSHSSVSASPSPNSGGSHGSIGPYWHSISSSEPTEFYSDEERSATADSSNGKHDSDEHPSPSQG